MENSYEGLKKEGKAGYSKRGFLPLDIETHQKIVERCYGEFPELPDPKQIIQYDRLQDVLSDAKLDATTLVFVDGGVTRHDIKLGKAVVVIDGGILKHTISSGVLFAPTGIVAVVV